MVKYLGHVEILFLFFEETDFRNGCVNLRPTPSDKGSASPKSSPTFVVRFLMAAILTEVKLFFWGGDILIKS